ncbi:hypothetical protein BJ322DRAFT_1113588 [Thelephora terrestris]|uniref:DUF6697 domain-containing protein n=1 Tax=Thelephora terrestris TaxID=56493 RepID=A0A9P6H4T4_9AGAM|nr:hypothetical protein BJ322DRAFT_1113588 [Thelephora terrestris]
MDEDYIADLEEEVHTLRVKVAELEEELSQAQKDLTSALERKIEEVIADEGIPPEEINLQNVTKKERKDEVSDPGIPVEHEESKPTSGRKPDVNLRASDLRQNPTLTQDDIIIVDSDSEEDLPRSQEPPIKRKPKGHPRDFLPANGKRYGSKSLLTKLKPDKKSLDDVSVFTRLSKVGLEIFPVTIEGQIQELSVSRRFLSLHFGGSPVGSYPTIGKKKLESHGFDNFMYVSLLVHPNAPSFPGAPGLWMCSCNCIDTLEDMRLIVRVQASPKALWQYMGQYDLRSSDPLSLQEWAMQSDRTRKAWVHYICVKGWGSYVRTRIELRRQLGRDQTDQEVEEFSGPQNVTEEDVLKAFYRGDERLYTWTPKCRGYDERFQTEIWTAAPGVPIKSENKSDDDDDDGL